jgi:glycosyltransferase involved in cell wall biosynthesis
MIKHSLKSGLVVYTGALGYAQPLEPLLMTAKRLRNLTYVICGSGELRPELLSLRGKLGLENVYFLEGLDRRNLEVLLDAADLCILPHALTQWARGALPVKFFEYLSAGRPILHYGARTEAADYIINNKLGVFVEGFDEERIAAGIERVISDRVAIRKMGKHARLLSRGFDRAAIANLLSNIVAAEQLRW